MIGTLHGKIKVNAVQNEEIRKGNYDAVLVAVAATEQFPFDMYNIFLRQPDFETYQINLRTTVDRKANRSLTRSPLKLTGTSSEST